MPRDILEFRRHLRRRRDALQRGKAFWRCQLHAALLFRRLAYDKPATVARYIYFKISKLFIYFEYFRYTVWSCQRYPALLFGEYVEDECYRCCPCRTIFSSFAGLSGVAGDTLQRGKGSGAASYMQRCCFGGWLTTSLPPPHDIY